MHKLPAHLAVYSKTPIFTESSVPAALCQDHATKAGVWGRIIVEAGQLGYIITATGERYILSPGKSGVIAPIARHRVEPLGPVAFYIEFLRDPDAEPQE
ncbi:MAG: DUF1971 domain-containing protein [Hyphomicrobiaceae bacterium]